MPSLAAFGIILLLVALNGLFVAAEFALLGIPRATVAAKAAEGDRLARRILGILKDVRQQDRYIATAQLGITMASLGLGGYGEHVLAEWIAYGFALFGEEHQAALHVASSVGAIVFLTYLHIVLGEMIPKSLAMQQPWKSVSRIAPWMSWVTSLTLPATYLLNGAGNLVLRGLGIQREGPGSGIGSPEELRHIVRESQEAGHIGAVAGRMLHEVIDFDSLLAREVLVPRVKVAGIPLGADALALARLIGKNPHTRYPVYRESMDQIVGMLHFQDVFERVLTGKAVTERDIRPVPFVPESASLNHVLKAMRDSRSQMCVILDEFGGTEGIITMGDLFREVIGKIPEGDKEVGEILEDGKGGAVVAGTARLEELGERFGVHLDHDEVDTVSGLILDRLGRPPLTGDTLEYAGLRFRVTSLAGHGVRWCKVSRIAENSMP